MFLQVQVNCHVVSCNNSNNDRCSNCTFYTQNKQRVDTLHGANGPEFSKKVEFYSKASSSPAPPPPASQKKTTESQNTSKEAPSKEVFKEIRRVRCVIVLMSFKTKQDLHNVDKHMYTMICMLLYVSMLKPS